MCQTFPVVEGGCKISSRMVTILRTTQFCRLSKIVHLSDLQLAQFVFISYQLNNDLQHQIIEYIMEHPLGIEVHPFERIESNEKALINEITEINKEMRKHSDGQEVRAQHGKTTAAATGHLILRSSLPAEIVSWLPESEGGHPVLVRFSNGNQQDDRVPDAHGCVIRLKNVEGAPAVKGMGPAGVHDLVLVDSPNFFTSGVAEYRDFSKTVAPTFFKSIILSTIDVFKDDAEMRAFRLEKLTEAHPEIGPRAAEFSSHTPGSPLRTEYTSATPFALGDRAMRWVLSPQTPALEGPVSSKHGLTEAARIGLLEGDVRFTLSVRLAADLERHCAEDEVNPWFGAQDVAVADLVLSPQKPGELETLIQEVESLAFSPWHAPMHLRPIGGINRCRGQVYQAMAALRTR